MYLWMKWAHVLSSTLFFGTGIGIAFFMLAAHLRGDARVIADTARTVVIADALFTAPAVLIQLFTGLWLASALGLPMSTLWISAALLLFVVIVGCWLPVLWLQKRARDLSRQAVADGSPLPAAYHRAMRWWFVLGWPAFIAAVVIFWLMVMKPT